MNEILKDKEQKARKAIVLSIYNMDDPYLGGADLFVSHHLEEVESSYWLKHTGEAQPSSEKVLSLLVLIDCWDEDLAFDFTLPEEVTNYVICVRFDEENEIAEISMES